MTISRNNYANRASQRLAVERKSCVIIYCRQLRQSTDFLQIFDMMLLTKDAVSNSKSMAIFNSAKLRADFRTQFIFYSHDFRAVLCDLNGIKIRVLEPFLQIDGRHGI